MDEQEFCAMLTRPAMSLTTTGMQQPYLGLQEPFRQEQVSHPFIDPGFLDAPTFMATGHGFTHNGTVLRGCWPIDGRL